MRDKITPVMLSRIVDDGGKMDEIDWADEPPAEGRWSVELGVDGPKERRCWWVWGGMPVQGYHCTVRQ